MSEWVGGTGDFTDPNFWSDGLGAPPPNPPPPPEFAADYLNSGEVIFSGNTNTSADINADMTFDVSGGGYTLTSLFGLTYGQGLVNPSQQSFALTLIGANTLSTPTFQVSGDPSSLTISQGAILDILNQGGNPVAFKSAGSLVVTDGGQFLLNDGDLDTGANASQQNLDVDDGTIVADGLSLIEVSVAVLDGSALTATAGSITLTDHGAADILTIRDSTLTATNTAFGNGVISVSGTDIAIGGTNTFTGVGEIALSALQTLTVSGIQDFASSDKFLGSGGGNELLSKGTVDIAAGAVVAASLGLAVSAPSMTIEAGASISASDSLLVYGGQMIASDAIINVGGTAEFGFGTADGVTLDSGTTMQAAAMLVETVLTVTGATTTLGISNVLMLDLGGKALDVAAGAAVSTGSLDIGIGTAVVEGTGSLLQVDGDAAIGGTTNGTLTVQNGGSVTVAGDLMIGTTANTNGSVTLDGDGTTLSVSGTVSVGNAGQGTLTVENGAVLDAPPDLNVGTNPPPEGAVPMLDPVTGFHQNNIDPVNIANGVIEAGAVDVGVAGYGAITTNGGTLSALDAVILGDQAGAEGQILLDGDDAELDTGDLTVGNDGKGLLRVGNGNNVNTDGDAVLAAGSGSLGLVTLDDGTGDPADQASWSISGALTVAQSGTATLLSNNSNLSVGGDGFVIGDGQGANGLLTMNASTLAYGGEITVGGTGTGELLFQLGSSVDTGTANTAPGFVLGAQMGGKGSLIVSGTLTVMNATSIDVGAFGKGNLQVTQGASLLVAGEVDIAAQEEGVIDSAVVSGGSYLDVGSNLTVGGLGVATLQVLSGAQAVAQGNATIADEKGASAVVTVSGTGTTGGTIMTPSILGFGDTLTIGQDGVGTLLVEAGAVVQPLVGATGTIDIGAADGKGVVTVEGTASLLQAMQLDIGGTGTAAGGAATLSILGGGTVDVSDVTLWSGGHITLSAGNLLTDPITINGGSISGSGMVTGAVTDDGVITATQGTLELTGAVSGGGSLSIGDGGTLRLDATGHVAAVRFVAGGANEVLALASATGLQATIGGFFAGDTVVVDDLIGAAPSFSSSGTAATLTFSNGPTALGSLVFAGSYTPQQLTFDATTGSVGTTAEMPCFVAGTLIRTAHGQAAVETLAAGDKVLTISGRLRPIRWIGERHVDCRRHRRPRAVLPMRILAHAFGEDRPQRDLFLSPDHAIFIEDVLIPIRYLENGISVVQVRAEAVSYYHIELEHHDVVLAEGLPAETFLDTGNRDAFINGGGATHLYPVFGRGADHNALLWEALGYAPLVVVGENIARARAMLRRRARMRGTRPDRQAALRA